MNQEFYERVNNILPAERLGRKPKILLLSDDLTATTGIATMSKTFICGTVDRFDWVQLASLHKHPKHGQAFDISEQIQLESGVPDAKVVVYSNTGYGDAGKLRFLIEKEKPDAILHFTDPRYWQWLYQMEYEIHQKYGLPIMYYAIWDNLPYPIWNKAAYASCDLIMGISRQSHLIHNKVLEYAGVKSLNIDEEVVNYSPNQVLTSYVPHGINSEIYHPITENHVNYTDFMNFKNKFRASHMCDFVLLWANRNIRRKSPADVIHAYKIFCDGLDKKAADKCVLIMHTDPSDPNGSDLIAVKKMVCPEYKIIFSNGKLSTKHMNYYYNLADVTLNIGSNEGFGLSSAESIMAGTVVINNVTGGLQDQMAFTKDLGGSIPYIPNEEVPSNHTGRYRDCGIWAYPIFPSNRSLQGSQATPYIFDDRVNAEDVAQMIGIVYGLSPEVRNEAGLEGRNWLINKAGMDSISMSDNMVQCINTCINTFVAPPALEVFEVTNKTVRNNSGIIYN